ncbi:MAG: hypothetical protein RLZZ381_861 [Cyanobacteriota bacterium]|jgi:hypothetical protein
MPLITLKLSNITKTIENMVNNKRYILSFVWIFASNLNIFFRFDLIGLRFKLLAQLNLFELIGAKTITSIILDI